ncbi:MAG: ParB/RepB/Spo0J family partition protein [Pseudonocardiaceae bacterium]
MDRRYDRTGALDAMADVRSATPSASSRDPILFVEVPLNERLADNPLGVRNSVGELDGLEASIRARGLLQPLIVARAKVFRLARPEASVNAEAEWVLLAGHRRREAARRTGIGTAIAIVRDDLVASEDSAAVALAENVHRAGLSPLEEARVLSVLRNLGLSQREISGRTGISQGQVSKRLQLLDLPAELRDRIDDGSLTVADALTILHELSDPQDRLRALRLSQGGRRSLKHVLSQLRRERTARNVAAEQGPSQDDESPSDGLEEADHDDSHVSVGGRQSEISAATVMMETILAYEEKDKRSGENREGLEPYATACSARIDACRRAVQSRLSVEQIVDVLVDATLDPPLLRSAHARDQAHSMAAEWTATILPKGLGASALHNGLRSTRDAARRLAVAIVLAHREIDLASAARVRQPWNQTARRHIRRLAAWGVHTLTMYERAKLAESSANED